MFEKPTRTCLYGTDSSSHIFMTNEPLLEDLKTFRLGI